MWLYHFGELQLFWRLKPTEGWNGSGVKGPAIFQYVVEDCPIDKACSKPLWRAAITDVDGRLVTSDNPLRTDGFYTVWFTSTIFGKPFERFTADRVAEFDLTNFWTWVNIDDRDIWNDPDQFDITYGKVQDRPYIRYAGPSPEFPGLYQLVFQLDPNAVWVRRCTEVWLNILIRPDDFTSQSVPVPVCP